MITRHTQNPDSTQQHTNDEAIQGRRTTPRRKDDMCAFDINGKVHPVIDWSQSGILIYGDSRSYSVGQTYEFVLKFKMNDRIVDIPHRGRVVRKTSQSIAFEFDPMSVKDNRKVYHAMYYQDTKKLLAANSKDTSL